MAKFSSLLREQNVAWPRNIWVGTSVTASANLNRIDDLLKVGDENTLRFLSVEPQIEAIDIVSWLGKLDWIIQGGESGADPRPFHLEWAADLLAVCKRSKTPYFLKQLGAKVHAKQERVNYKHGHGGEWSEWPPELRVREVPTVAGRYRQEILAKAAANKLVKIDSDDAERIRQELGPSPPSVIGDFRNVAKVLNSRNGIS